MERRNGATRTKTRTGRGSQQQWCSNGNNNHKASGNLNLNLNLNNNLNENLKLNESDSRLGWPLQWFARQHNRPAGELGANKSLQLSGRFIGLQINGPKVGRVRIVINLTTLVCLMAGR